MKRFRVLFLTPWYPEKARPIDAIFIREHAKAVSLYDDVVVLQVAEEPKKDIKGFFTIEKETDEGITQGIPTYRVWHKDIRIRKIWYLFYLWGVFKAFHFILSQGFQPDIIHAHYFSAGVPAVLIGKIYSIPVVITEHYSGFPKRMLRRIDVLKARYAFRWADFVLPVSSHLQRSIEGYGIKANFEVIPNVVDTKLFFPDIKDLERNGGKKMLFVGLLDASGNKGLHFLLKAVQILRSKRKDWHLDIIGDGPRRKEYERMTAQLGLSNMVAFHGLRTKKEVAEFMRQSDLFILPSLCETFSVATAEAMACGLPVLVTRCGGLEEFVTDDVGIIVPPGDVYSLFKGIEYILENLRNYSPEKIHRHSIQRFGPEVVGSQIHHIYKKCLKII